MDVVFQLNIGGVGFYRTLYPPDMLEKLLPAVRDQSLPPRDRLQLQGDLFALVRTSVPPLQLSLRLPINICIYYDNLLMYLFVCLAVK